MPSGFPIKLCSNQFAQLQRLARMLTLNAPIATKVVCYFHLLKYLRSLYGKQCGPRSDCSYRSSLFWVHAVCFYTEFVSNVRQLFAADHFSRRHFQMHFYFGALRVKIYKASLDIILCKKKITKALIRLCSRAGCSVPLLFTCISQVFSCCGPYIFPAFKKVFPTLAHKMT